MSKTRATAARAPSLAAMSLAAMGLAAMGLAGAARAAPYPAMAPIGEYLIHDRAAEIALARSAAPPSIAAEAGAYVLTAKGYELAVPSKNGFVCIVERAWFSGLKDEGFWNPKLRGPDCYNREAARSVLPTFQRRTQWVLAGASQAEILKRTRAEIAAHKIPAPEPGAMNYMLSKQGYLGDRAGGPWRPHLMFYMPARIPTADWGADAAGSPVASAAAGIDPYTMFFVPVAAWSDGSPDEKAPAPHAM